MSVLAFPRNSVSDRSPHWHRDELQQLVGIFAAHAAKGGACGWDSALTERGDPQFYLLGPAPQEECVLCISRLGRHYLLEDGGGGVVHESSDLAELAAVARRMAPRARHREFLAPLLLAGIALRQHYQEKLERVLAEPVELLTHVFPPLAAVI